MGEWPLGAIASVNRETGGLVNQAVTGSNTVQGHYTVFYSLGLFQCCQCCWGMGNAGKGKAEESSYFSGLLTILLFDWCNS